MTHPRAPNVAAAPSLISEFFVHAKRLIATELRLARTELSQAASRAGTGAIYLALALLFALVAFHALALTGVLALTALGIPMVWAALGTTVLVLLIAVIFAVAGSYCLKKSTLAPTRTLKNLRTDLSSLEEATRV